MVELNEGKEFTAKQITAYFGIAHPASAVRRLRELGHCVYSNPVTLSNGTASTRYRVGSASRRMVAIAAAMAGADVFTRS